MMSAKKIIPLLMTTTMLVGCSNKNKPSSSEPVIEDNNVTVNMKAYMNSEKASTGYDLKFEYEDRYFDVAPNQFSKDLMKISFASSLASTFKDSVRKFFSDLKFEEKFIAPSYDVDPTENSIGYYIASKTIEGQEVYALSIRGFEYKMEWSNNFLLGTEGDHNGFAAKADEIYAKVKEVMGTDLTNKKLWVTGYSRAGAIANVLSYKLLSSEELLFNNTNLYTYTFEAPKGLLEEHAIKYDNVFNLINSADPIPYVAPQAYGMYRCGADIEINPEGTNVETLLRQFDKDITLPAFTPKDETYQNEKEFNNYLIGLITGNKDEADQSAATREEFVSNYQESLRYMIGLFFSLDDSVTKDISEEFNKLDALGKAMLLTTDGIYNFLKPILDRNNVNYDDDALKAGCASVLKLLVANPQIVLLLMTGDTNLNRGINMHMPETTYVLLNNLQ